jgi:hypothetical protein
MVMTRLSRYGRRANYTGILQESAYVGFYGLSAAGRRPGPTLKPACGARDTTKIAELRKCLPNLGEGSLAAFPTASVSAVNVGGND